jgi:hypothetical protein
LGSIWYNPKVFGSAWMKCKWLSMKQKLKEGFNMPLVFGLTLVFGYLMVHLSFPVLVIHQMGFFSMLQNHFMSEEATENS